MEAELSVVARKNEIVAIVVRDERILMPIVEGVEQAIGVFFGLVEPNDVVLILVAQAVSEDANSSIGVRENKASKVARKWLRACSNRQKVVVGAHVRDLGFVEPLFDCPSRSDVDRAIRHVRRDDSQLLNFERSFD